MYSLMNLWEHLLSGIPDILAALVILLVAYLSALLVKIIIKKLLQFLRFDSLPDKSRWKKH